METDAQEKLNTEISDNKNAGTEVVEIIEAPASETVEVVIDTDLSTENSESAILAVAQKIKEGSLEKEKPVKNKIKRTAKEIPSIEFTKVKTRVDKAAVLSLTRRIFLAKWPLLLVPAILLIAIGGLVMGVMMANFNDGAIPVGVGLMASGVALPMLIFLVNFFVMLPKNAATATEWRKKTLVVEISNERIFIRQKTTPLYAEPEYSDEIYSWSRIIKVISNKSYLFLFITKRQVIIINTKELEMVDVQKLKKAIKYKIKDNTKIV